MKISLVVLLTLLFLGSKGQGVSEKYLSDIHLGNTQMIRFKGATATCYLVADSNVLYFITVLHLFSQKKVRNNGKTSTTKFSQYDSLLCKNGDDISVDLFSAKTWKPLQGKIYFFDKPGESIDLCVIKVNERTNFSSLYLLEPGVFLGQQCFFVGYPLGLKSLTDSTFKFDLPIVKNAIYSGSFTNEHSKERVILLDGNNTYGLSGSPIFAYNPLAKGWRMIGMVTSYYKQTDHVLIVKRGLLRQGKKIVGSSVEFMSSRF